MPGAAFTPDDLFKEQRVEHLDLRPGGDIAVCELKTVERDDDAYQSHLWLLPMDGRPLSRLTFAPGRNIRPRWSPQGERIAFLSDRHGGAAQIYLIDHQGGEARQLTRFASTVVDMAWHPGGRHLAVLCAVNVDPDERASGAQKIDLARPLAPPTSPEVVWRLPYKMDGAGYTLGARLQLVLYDIDSGTTTPLTRGDFDVGQCCWSPDGSRLAIIRNREDERDSHCKDLWILDLGDKPRAFPSARRLTNTIATACCPAWSPDGEVIALMGARDGGDPIMRLWQVEVSSGVLRQVGDDDLELVGNDLFWDARGPLLRAVQAWRGVQRIVAIDMKHGTVTPLVEPAAGHVSAMVAREAMVFAEEGIDHPIEVHRCDLDGSAKRRLTDFNAWWRERLALVTERRRFTVPDGDGGEEEIEGWLLRRAQPRTSDSSAVSVARSEPSAPLQPSEPLEPLEPAPLLMDVHGGPASYVMLKYASNPYWQVLASQGWTVLALNAVGSASYGRPFSQRLRRNWGRLDLPQYRSALAALRREGLADGRVAIAGSSYGGYFSAYATGNCSDFRAALVNAPVGNLETHYGTSDSGYYADPYSMEGKPETDRELMIELSPMAHISRSRTPTLFLQGKDDERCPKCQSEEMFVKLRRSGTVSELVLYPQGDHHLLRQGRPSHRIDAHGRIVAWLTRWVEEPLPVQPTGSDPADAPLASRHRP
ncbi:prolyl oligopeptidase family serine peptidase [Roseateles chitinivorans]|uniref:S9 family peptidase n=1 Tax=Roseateles chitinivorans TaxID=2917965 RepID=UPI003D66FCA5